jgi:hypothetical protein
VRWDPPSNLKEEAMKNRISGGSVAIGLAAAAGSALAQVPTVKYSTIHTSPTSLVPGGGGLRFGTTSGSTTGFDRPYRSLSGAYWIISAVTNTGATTSDEFIIAGLMGAETVQVQEGITQIESGRVADTATMDTKLAINDSGEFAFTANLSGATTDDEVIAKGAVGGSVSVAAREGQSTPLGVAGATLDSPNITNAGRVSFRVTPITGQATAQNTGGFDDEGGTVRWQKGITIPTGQAGGGTQAIENTFAGDFYVSADGSDWLLSCDLTGATTSDAVVIVNGDVKVQEGSPIPGLGNQSNVLNFTEALMMPSGDWLARGELSDDNDWMVMNGAKVAETGDAVPGGLPGEVLSEAIFDATFFTMTADGNGNFVYGATTSNPDVEKDAVLVYNNERVVARQGDGVDLDGNGQLDDDAFIDIFNNDDIFLLDDGTLLFTAEIYNSALASLGQAVITISLAPGCAADFNGDNQVDFFDYLDFASAFDAEDPAADFNGDNQVDFFDYLDFAAAFDAGCE